MAVAAARRRRRAAMATLIDEAKRGNAAQVTALLAARIADPNMADPKGNTPLHHAVDKGAGASARAS